MSFFDAPNTDAYQIAPEQATAGPAIGFADGFRVAWNATVKDASTFGIQEAMRNKDDQQVQALRAAGVDNVPSLSKQSDDPMRMFTDFGQDYLDTAKFYQEGGNPAEADYLTKYDTQINDLKKRFPALNLQTSQEMWESTRQEAVKAEQDQATLRTSPLGAAGEFLGGMAGGLNPNTSPVSFATLPFGGLGKSVVGRVVEQAGIQAGSQAVNEFNGITGVGEQRKLLGFDDGQQGSIERIGEAALGGAVAQGIGEVAGFGLRRMFRSTPKEPVPDVSPQPKEALPRADTVPPNVVPADEAVATARLVQVPQSIVNYFHEQSPWSLSRAGRARTSADLDYMHTQLDDWNGPRPWEVEPQTDTAPVRPASSDFEAPPTWRDVSKQADINATMRRLDPDTMTKWDQAADDKKTAQIQLAMATSDRDAQTSAIQSQKIQTINDEIARTNAKIANVGAMKAKKLRATLADLTTQRDAALQETITTDTPAMSVIRQRVMAADERMRDLAPLVTRAKVHAQGKWDATEGDHEVVIQAIRDARRNVADTQGAEPGLRAPSLPEKVPLLQRAPEFQQAGKIPAGADAIDTAKIITAEDVKTYEEATDAMRGRLKAILGEEAEPEVSVAGYPEKLHLDTERFSVEQPDGTIKEASLREHLQDQLDDDEDIKAISSCSIP